MEYWNIAVISGGGTVIKTQKSPYIYCNNMSTNVSSINIRTMSAAQLSQQISQKRFAAQNK